jgi:hypothetical protein
MHFTKEDIEKLKKDRAIKVLKDKIITKDKENETRDTTIRE